MKLKEQPHMRLEQLEQQMIGQLVHPMKEHRRV